MIPAAGQIWVEPDTVFVYLLIQPKREFYICMVLDHTNDKSILCLDIPTENIKRYLRYVGQIAELDIKSYLAEKGVINGLQV